MIRYAILDDDGYVVEAGSQLTLPAGAVALPKGVTPAASFNMRLVEAAFVPRPDLALPAGSLFEETGRALQWVDLPAGTTAEIVDTEFGFVLASLAEMAGTISIELVDPGRYRVELTPPRPHLPMTVDIEVPV